MRMAIPRAQRHGHPEATCLRTGWHVLAVAWPGELKQSIYSVAEDPWLGPCSCFAVPGLVRGSDRHLPSPQTFFDPLHRLSPGRPRTYPAQPAGEAFVSRFPSVPIDGANDGRLSWLRNRPPAAAFQGWGRQSVEHGVADQGTTPGENPRREVSACRNLCRPGRVKTHMFGIPLLLASALATISSLPPSPRIERLTEATRGSHARTGVAAFCPKP
jgi:hypothetical protein